MNDYLHLTVYLFITRIVTHKGTVLYWSWGTNCVT